MALAAPVRTPKKKHRITCLHCGKRPRMKSKTAKYCNAACRNSARNESRRVTYLYNATNSPFFQELARQAIRARTELIFEGFTEEDLGALYDVYALAQKYNGYGERKSAGLAPFELSHICPVRGETTVGLFRADNLVIAPRGLNRSHSVRHFSGGASISRAKVSPRHFLGRDSNQKEVIERIIKIIGEDTVLAVVESRKIQPAKRHALVCWLREHLDHDNPDHAKHFAILESASATVLAGIKREVQGKEALDGSGWSPRMSDEVTVLLAEWERIGKAYRPDILPAIERLRFIEAGTSRRLRLEFEIDDAGIQMVFDMLHGKPVSTVKPLIDAVLDKALSNDMVYQPTLELKALGAVVVPRVLGCFSSELDGELISFVPRLTGLDPHADDVPLWSL